MRQPAEFRAVIEQACAGSEPEREPAWLLETCRMRIPIIRSVPDSAWKAVSIPRRRRGYRSRSCAEPVLDRVLTACVAFAIFLQTAGAWMITLP